MTSPTDRITEVIREHRWLEVEWACHCGNRHLRLADHPAHVAERITAELALTEENRTLTNGWIQPMYAAPYYAMGMEPPPAVITHERRWVSAWTAAEQ